MRWPALRPVAPTAARLGDKRTIRRFAWWPTLVDLDDEVPARVWLEHFYEYQSFAAVTVSDNYGGSWTEYRWTRQARYSGDPLIDAALHQLEEDAIR